MKAGAGRPSSIEIDRLKLSSKDEASSAPSSATSRSAITPKTPKTPLSAISNRSSKSVTSARSASTTKSDSSRASAELLSEEDEPAGVKVEQDARGISGTSERKQGVRVDRTRRHTTVRAGVLYIVPVILLFVASLLLTLTRLLIEPLYNSLPLKLHPGLRYAIYAILPALIYWRITVCRSAQEAISARVCLAIAAIGGDFIAVFGRRVGSLSGRALGAEWGATASLAMLGVTIAGGVAAFSMLCFDHILPVRTIVKPTDKARNLVQISFRSAGVTAHVWAFEQAWQRLLRGNTSTLVQHPEKSILFVSILLTLLSLILRSPGPSTTLARQTHSALVNRFKPTPKVSNQLLDILSYLPQTFFPLLLLLRLPLLLLAVRQQLLHHSTPYFAANGTLRVLHSERSITGQIVVAENVQAGYRFLRCDASILGGRWYRERPNPQGGITTDMGDSIFGTFSLQEVGLLAQRNDESDSLARTLALTTNLRMTQDFNATGDAESSERALIIGLGVGIAAQAFSQQSLEVDMVEIDPVVYQSATRFFNLNLPESSTTVNLVDGAEYVRSMARMVATGEIESPNWRIAVQDCFTGGMVPSELFTREFWEDLRDLMAHDGIVTMNFVGLYGSKASRAVLVTLLSVFNQCRAFGDAAEAKLAENDSVNMVVLCTMAYSPLLTFRKPRPSDILRSPLRSHVYSTFLANEIQLDGIIQPHDWSDPELLLKRGDQKLDAWQVKTALDTWKAMQRILTPEMWLAY